MDSHKMKEIGKRIEQVRRRLGLRQCQMAEKIAVPQTTYSRYENAERTPTWEFVKVLCNKFDIDDDWLYSGEGSMFKSKTETPANQTLQAEIETLKKEIQDLDKQNKELGDELRKRLTELLDLHTKQPINTT